ncbi:hypothetical protein G6F36_015143 [Rhizopus arrhizus]|nr:hypothetical protein G6F36_015143 [Rhizopus arrhizus]
MKSDPKSNHSIVPRFYIAKNRTLLRQIRSQGVLAIFYNTKTSRVKSTKLIRIETDMILAYPASDLFDIDQINEYTEDFAPKAWIHLRPLRVVQHMVFEQGWPLDDQEAAEESRASDSRVTRPPRAPGRGSAQFGLIVPVARGRHTDGSSGGHQILDQDQILSKDKKKDAGRRSDGRR